jgi:multidrug transporter EmrE-like cation transporter
MQPRYRSILIVLIASILSATAQILFKTASKSLNYTLGSFVFNIPLIIGFIVYAMVAFLFLIALKNGELTVLYPLLATAYVWVAIASPFFFQTDSLTGLKIVGILTIITGVYCMGRGMQQKVEVV